MKRLLVLGLFSMFLVGCGQDTREGGPAEGTAKADPAKAAPSTPGSSSTPGTAGTAGGK